MNNKLIKLLVAFAHSENSDFGAELRSEVDVNGFVSFFINYINPEFSDILNVNCCTLTNVAAVTINKKLMVTINLNDK
jgi:hypothetical protein